MKLLRTHSICIRVQRNKWNSVIWLASLVASIEITLAMESKESCSVLIYPGEHVRMTANAVLNLSCDFSSCEIDLQKMMPSRFWFLENGRKMDHRNKTVNTIATTLVNIDAKVNSTYTCHTTQPENIVTTKEVVVGDLPGPVHNFTCISEDYKNWRCSFKAFDRVPVNYTAAYIVGIHIYHFPCINKAAHDFECECSLERKAHTIYEFLLNSSNCFGEVEENYCFEIAKQVIPGGLKLQVKNVNSTSAKLNWTILTENLRLYKDGFILKVKYGSDAKSTWKSLETSTCKVHSEMELKDLLPYSHYWVEMKVKAAKARIGPEMWKHANIKFQTMPQQPLNAPTTDPGGFFIDNNKCAHIFWKAFPRHMLNGTNFSYRVSVVNKAIAYNNSITSNTSKYFYKHNICGAGQYEFTVYAENSEGVSSGGSIVRIVVPSDYRNQGLSDPKNIISFYNDTSYKLEWIVPEYPESLYLIDYTILFCSTKVYTNSFEFCKDPIEFIHVPADQTEAFFSKGKRTSLMFALSANYREGSSGMTISYCAPHENSALRRLEPELDTTTDSSIKLKWTLTCNQRTLVKGYTLKYCAVDAYSKKCINAEQTVRNISNDKTEYTITNLKPFTSYHVYVKMISRVSEGPFSLPLMEKTDQGAPSSPLNLKICSIRDDGATVEWERPEFPNGIIKFYYIIINGSRSGQMENATTDRIQSFHVRNLESFEKYTIQVQAANIWNNLQIFGESSNMVMFWTRARDYQYILSPHVEVEGGMLSVSWNPPRGYDTSKGITYELKWSYGQSWEYYTLKNETKHSISCSQSAQIRIFIRAIFERSWKDTFDCPIKCQSMSCINDTVSSTNLSAVDEHWLLIYDFYCSPDAWSWHIPTLSFLLCIIFGLLGVTMYKKHEKMKSLSLVVPPALDDIMEHGTKDGFNPKTTPKSLNCKSIERENSGDSKENKPLVGDSGYIQMSGKLNRAPNLTKPKGNIETTSFLKETVVVKITTEYVPYERGMETGSPTAGRRLNGNEGTPVVHDKTCESKTCNGLSEKGCEEISDTNSEKAIEFPDLKLNEDVLKVLPTEAPACTQTEIQINRLLISGYIPVSHFHR